MCNHHDQTYYYYLTGASTPNQAHFGVGTGPIWLDDVACTGTEARLLDCGSRPIGVHNCNHPEDAGTRCIPVFSKCTTSLSHNMHEFLCKLSSDCVNLCCINSMLYVWFICLPFKLIMSLAAMTITLN